ncbi:MAG: S9 family peptidase [Saprospiraceae bacterium]|nr:S9 family peptidase [Saprospiraceae bacterium]
MKFFLLLLLMVVALTTNNYAQKLDISLEDAVLGQWRKFYPRGMNNLNWRKDRDQYTFLSKDSKNMMVQQVGSQNAAVFFSLNELNTALNEKFERIPNITFESSSAFSFQFKGRMYWLTYEDLRLSLKKDKNSFNQPSLIKIIDNKIIDRPKGANVDFHKPSKQFAYTIDNNLYFQNNQGKQLSITSFEDKNIVSGQAIARYEFGIGKGTFWSPDGQFLAFYQKDESDVADYPLLDITTTPGTLKEVKYPMAGQKSEYAKVGIYDTKTGKTVYLKVDGPKDQYLTNLGWGPENKFVYVAVVNRAQNHMWLNKYNALDGNYVHTLFEETHKKYVEPEHPVWFIPGNNKEFLWWSERDGFMHLHKYNHNGKHLGQITSGEWVTLDILGLDAEGKNILVTGTDKFGLNTTVYSAALSGGKKSQRIVKEDGKHNFKLSNTKKYLIDNYSDIYNPNITRIINLEGKEINKLHQAENPYINHNISSPEIIQLEAEDGQKLNARMIKPADFDSSKKYPVIVYVYGGPHAQMVKNSWLANASLWMYHIANKGYLVFTLDNRGSANRGFEFENIIHRQLGKLEMKDQLVGVEYLKSLSYADTDKMAVHGWSYGGYMTTSLMLKYPDVFKVGVAGGPVTDWKYYEIMYGERYMDMPDENSEGYKETQLSNFVEGLEGDLLLIHGTIDDIVVMQHNLSLVQAFVDKGILIDFFPYPMHPHNVRGKDRVHLMNKVLTYIEDKLAK